MNRDVIITCALSGGGDGHLRSPHVPITPEGIAEDALRAARAGAAAVHIHVRDPVTGAPSRKTELYREVVERIRDVDDQLLINLTGGMGGELQFGPADDPLQFAPGQDFVGPAERIEHIVELRPDLASLDTGSLNFGEGLYGTTPAWLEDMAQRFKESGVRPEVEVFELGHIELAKHLQGRGAIDTPALFQLCLGVRYGAPATPEALMAMRDSLPAGSLWAAFGLGAQQLPVVGLATLLGGHVRVGLEDNLYLSRGELATNAQLVERARDIVEVLGHGVMSAADARALLAVPPSSHARPSAP